MPTEPVTSCVLARRSVGVAATTALVWLALSTLGCSDDDERPGPAAAGSAGSSGTAGTGGTGGTGGAAGAGTGGTGGSDAGASGGGGGTGGAAAGAAGTGGEPSVCGDSMLGAGEQCDGNDFGGKTCVTFGFETGALDCSACAIVSSGCSGVERCFDGHDNDGDVDIDCGDPDCAAPCAATCAEPPVLTDPAAVSGSTISHPADGDLACAISGVVTGSEIAYQITTAQSGVLDVLLTSDAQLGVEVRTSCGSAGSSLACTLRRRIIVPVSQGQALFIVVDGIDASSSGAFDLEVRSRSTVCGDTNRDPAEECDDGNTQSGDGCSASCSVESSESASNDSAAQASPLSNPFFGTTSSGADVDYVRVVLNTAGSIVADVVDFGDNACEHELLDSIVDIIDAAGTTPPLATDDDSGVGFCSHAVMATRAAGTYYVRVSSAGDSFPYVLEIAVDNCGNGSKSEGEECDDSNNVAFDGCSPMCKLE